MIMNALRIVADFFAIYTLCLVLFIIFPRLRTSEKIRARVWEECKTAVNNWYNSREEAFDYKTKLLEEGRLLEKYKELFGVQSFPSEMDEWLLKHGAVTAIPDDEDAQ